MYVFTALDPNGLTDDETTERLTAVADMKKRLEKNDAVQLVDDADASKVSVEIVSAGAEEGNRKTVATTVVAGGVAFTQRSQTLPEFIGRATITSGTFRAKIDASIGPFGRSYGENLGRKFEDWLKKNREALQKP